MNETIQNIKSRRSTRIFLPEQIKEGELQAIIEAGLYAPSAHNQQSWHFTVIENKEIMDGLNFDAKEVIRTFENQDIAKMGSNEKFNVFYNAPIVILVSGEETAMLPVVDSAAATENMMLAAESLGVGACWVGLGAYAFGGEKGKKNMEKLAIPEGYTPYYAVALGYKKTKGGNAPARRENTVNYVK